MFAGVIGYGQRLSIHYEVLALYDYTTFWMKATTGEQISTTWYATQITRACTILTDRLDWTSWPVTAVGCEVHRMRGWSVSIPKLNKLVTRDGSARVWIDTMSSICGMEVLPVNYSLFLGDKHSSNGLAPNIFGARAMVATLRLTNGYIRNG